MILKAVHSDITNNVQIGNFTNNVLNDKFTKRSDSLTKNLEHFNISNCRLFQDPPSSEMHQSKGLDIFTQPSLILVSVWRVLIYKNIPLFGK